MMRKCSENDAATTFVDDNIAVGVGYGTTRKD
jgi:hypothetical protein